MAADTCIIIGLTNGSHTVELCSSNRLFYHTLLTKKVKGTFMRSLCCVCVCVCVTGRESDRDAHLIHPISVFQPADLISQNLFNICH